LKKYLLLGFIISRFWFNVSFAQTEVNVLKSIYTTGIKRIGIDKAGNLYLCGYFNGEFKFGKQFYNEREGKYFISKVSPDYQPIWLMQFVQPVKEIAVADSAIYLFGQFQRAMKIGQQLMEAKGDFNAFLAKLDLDGQLLWHRQFTSSRDALANALVLDNQENIYITGGFLGDIDIAGTQLKDIQFKNIYLARFTPQGNLAWVRQATGGNNPLTGVFVRSLATDDSGSVYWGGGIAGNAVFGSEKLSSSKEYFGGEGAMPTMDIFLAKYSSGGDLIWLKNIAQNAELQEITLDNNQCIYLTGYFRGSANINKGLGESTFEDTKLKTSIAANKQPHERMYLAKYSPLGNLIWVKKADGNGDNRGVGLIYSKHKDRVYVSGIFNKEMLLSQYVLTNLESSTSEKSDIFLACFKPNGAIDWAVSGGGAESEELAACKADHQGNIYLIGRFKFQAVFGEFVLEAEGASSNGFIVKY
jgi:hypothetical protein